MKTQNIFAAKKMMQGREDEKAEFSALVQAGLVSPQSLEDPTTNATFFTIIDANGNEYDAYLDLKEITNFYAFQMRYKREGSSDSWTYLSPSRHPAGNFNVTLYSLEKTNEMFDNEVKCALEIARICDGFTAVINEVFGVPNQTEKPKSGLALLAYMVKNQVKYIDRKLITVE